MKTEKGIRDRFEALEKSAKNGVDLSVEIGTLKESLLMSESKIDELAQASFLSRKFRELRIYLWVLEG